MRTPASKEKIVNALQGVLDLDSEITPEAGDLLELLTHDSDKGCLLALGSFLDDAIQIAIRAKFSLSGISESDIDFLLTRGPVPPIGSFGVRVVMARALGIIDDPVYRTLRAITDLRNESAHSWASFTITTESIHKIDSIFEPDGPRKLARAVEGQMARDGHQPDELNLRLRLFVIAFKIAKEIIQPSR
jgi:hypothetical protein